MTSVLGVISISAVTTAGAIIINQISSLSTNVFALITNIVSVAKISTTIYQTELIKLLTKTDVEATLKLLHAIILEIPLHINLEDEKMKEITGITGNAYGVIAQEVQKEFPEMVEMQENGYLAVDYRQLVPVIIEAIKELKCELDLLKKVE